MDTAKEIFSRRICKQLTEIFKLRPEEIEVQTGSQPHLYYRKILLGYMDSPFVFCNNPDYAPGREREDYPKHAQWHPVFSLFFSGVQSCACGGQDCVPDIKAWRPPIILKVMAERQKAKED